MKFSLAAVVVHAFSFFVSTGEALGQLTEERVAGLDLDGVVDSVNTAELQQTTRYTSLQVTDDSRSKNTGGNSGNNGNGRRHHNNHGSRRQHHDCNNNDIAECVELLEVLTNKDLGFAATVDELNKMCPVLLEGLQCIDNYTRRCLTQKHRDYFNKLYAGTIRVIKDLCNTRGRYQEEYIRHAPCMRQVNPKYNVCSVTYHRKTVALNHMQDASVTLSEDEKNRNVIILCCSFQEYLQCSERVVFETCGNETALFTKEFLDRMAGPIVQGQCSPILNLYPCPRDLFPTDPEGLTRPDSFTTDPSPSPTPTPIPTMPAPRCNSTSQHEAAAGGEEPQLSVAASPTASSPPPKPLRTTPFTYGTIRRTVMPLPVQDEAESSVVEDASLLRDPDVEKAVAVRNYTSSTVRSHGVLRQPELNLEAVSLHELECVAAEGHQSSESPREHGHPDAPVESATSLPTLLVASSLLKLVNLPQARSTEHDDTSTNGLTNPSASSKNLDTNLQSALYSSDFNLTLPYSLPRSRRPRPPAGKAPHRPRAGSWNGLTRTRSRAVGRGHVAGPQRRVPSKNGSRRLSLQPTNTSTLPWHIRHSRRHFRLPLRRRGVFRRRRPPVTRPASDVGQGKHRITNSSKVEARLKPPFWRRRLRVSLNHKGTTSLSHHDEEQETNSELTLKVTKGEETMTVSPAVSSVSLQPLHPEATFPEDANMAIPPATIPRPVAGVGNGRTGNPISPEGRPRRRHRKPGRRPHLPWKLEGVRRRPGRRRRPGWRRMKRPLWAASSTPTPLIPSRLSEITSQDESTDNYDDLNMHSMEGNQETVLEVITAGSDTTLTTPLLNTATESEMQLGRPGDQQPTSVTTPTSSTSLEAPTETLDAVDEIWTTVRPVDPVLLKGHTQDLPDIATQEGRGVSTPWRDTQDTDGTTTKRSTTTTTTSMAQEPLLAMTHTPTTDDPASSSDRTQLDDDDAEFDVQDILPVDSSSGEGHLLLDADNMWLQNLFLSELREAVIPAPTPVPYTVRLWLEHDKKAADKAFINQFVPLALDVVESDFVPLTHPVATVTEKDTSSDMFENEKSDDSGIGYVKDVDEVEATLVEEVIPPGDVVPPSQKQHPTTTAATVSRNDPLNFTYGLALDSVLPLGGDASDLSNGVETDLRSPPTISEIELHHKGATTEERKEKKKKKKDKKKKETIAARRDQSNHKKKQNTVRPQRPIITDDLGGHDKTPHAVLKDITNDSSPGRSSNIQLTFIPTNPTLSTPASPPVSIAMNYSHSSPHQETDVEHNAHVHAHVHAPPDTPFPIQDSADNLFSSNKSQSQDQPPENDSGAPDRPAAADNNRGELLEGKETHGDSGAEAPLLHAVVAMAVLFTVL